MEDAKRRPGASNFASALGTPPSGRAGLQNHPIERLCSRLETFDAFRVGAAPLLIDDASTASPELALVDPDLADRLRSAPTGSQRWEAPRRPSDVTTGGTVAVIEGEELSPTETAPLLDGEATGITDESSDEVQAFEAFPILPKAGPGGTLDETDAFLRSIEAGTQIADQPMPDDLSDLIVRESVPPSEAAGTKPAESSQNDVSEAAPVNDYPTLPTSGELDEAVEETDAALRRMREHLTSDEPSRRQRRVGRSVTAAAGICAIGAVGILAADAHLGLATLAGRFVL